MLRASGPTWSRLATNGKLLARDKPPVGRLQAKNAAQRGRHADRAVCIGAKRQWYKAGGDGDGRATRRTSTHPLQIVRIMRGAIVHVLAGEIVGIFAHVERADQNGAGGFETFDQSRVASGGRRRAIDFRSGQGRHIPDVEQVLDGERHAGKRTERFAGRSGEIRILARRRAPALRVIDVKELSSGSRSLIRSSVASMTLVALTLPLVTAAAMSAAPLHINVSAGALSMEDRRRLSVVGQIGKAPTRAAWSSTRAKVEFHAVTPARIDRRPSACAPAVISPSIKSCFCRIARERDCASAQRGCLRAGLDALA